MEEGGAVSFGVAIAIFIYFAYIKKDKPKKNVTYTFQTDYSDDNDRIMRTEPTYSKSNKQYTRKSPEEYWKGKSESEFKWRFEWYHKHHDEIYEWETANPYPQPEGIPEYFEYLKVNKPNSFEYDVAVKIASDGNATG